MATTINRAFRSSQHTSRWLAVVVTLLALLLFAVIVPFAPPSPGEDTSGFHFGTGFYQALQALLAAVFSIGLISVLYEAFLRKTYSQDLSFYLGLRASMVASGIQDVTPRDSVDWQSMLSEAATVRVLLRDPMAWLPANQTWLLQSARKRAVQLTVAVPDEDGADFARVAASCGQTSDQLREAVKASVAGLERAWEAEAESKLTPGTRFRIVTYDTLPTYELVAADDKIVVLLGPVEADRAIGQQLCLVFDTSREGYPADWLAPQAERLDRRNPIAEKMAK